MQLFASKSNVFDTMTFIHIHIVNIQWSLAKWFLIICFSAHCCRFMCSEGLHLHPKTMISQVHNMEKSVVLLLEASQMCRWRCFVFCTQCSRASNFLGDPDDPQQQAALESGPLTHQREVQKYISWGMCLGSPSNTWLYRGSSLLA